MITVTCPSQEIPGPVPVSIDVPNGWLVQPAPGVVFVAAAPEESAGVHANAVVSIRRVDSDLTIEQLGRLVTEEISQLPGCVVTREDRVDAGGQVLDVRDYHFVNPADGSKVHQMQAMCVAPVATHVADAVTVTVTHGQGLDEAEISSLRAVIESLRVG